MLILILFYVPCIFGLTEVILTRNQFNDFVEEMQKISMDISVEDANITLDLTAIEILITEQNYNLLNMIDQLKSIDLATKQLYQPLLDITSALSAQTQKLEEKYDDWYSKFETIMTPINQFLSSIHNAIGIIKDTIQAVQSIFEAFQGTQDEAVASLETNVEIIASNFEVGMKAIVAEALAGSGMSFEAVVCGAWEGDACESALGEGPIVCEGMETEFCQMEGIVVEPIRKKRELRKQEL